MVLFFQKTEMGLPCIESSWERQNLHQNGNTWVFMFFSSVCLRIRGKLFLVVSYHVFEKEKKFCFTAVTASDRPSRWWLWCAGSHGESEGWLLLSLQVLAQRHRLMEVELKLLVLGSLTNITCHKQSLRETLQMVTFSCHQYPLETLWVLFPMNGKWDLNEVLQLSTLFSCQQGGH